jgi:ectoine hydroxylase
MKLTQQQLELYKEEGMIFIPECFCKQEVKRMDAALIDLMQEDNPGRVLEKDKKTVRSLHGCNTASKVFHDLILHSRLLEPVKQILTSDVYLYQFKINLKAAFDGDLWPWHQDFVFWDKDDGMPSPKAVNIAIFLDEVNEFNGPIYFITGSHKESYTHIEAPLQVTEDNAEKTEWMENFVVNLKYTLDKPTITKLVNKGSLVAPQGISGSVLFFHCNLVHGSLPNISPYDRRLIIITYNSVDNIPISKGKPRPEFLVNQDYTPLQPLADKVLIS